MAVTTAATIAGLGLSSTPFTPARDYSENPEERQCLRLLRMGACGTMLVWRPFNSLKNSRPVILSDRRERRIYVFDSNAGILRFVQDDVRELIHRDSGTPQ